MSWQECIHRGMQEQVSSSVLDYCNKIGGTASADRTMILRFGASIKAIPAKPTQLNNQLMQEKGWQCLIRHYVHYNLAMAP